MRRGRDTVTFDIAIAVGSLERLWYAGALTSRTLALHAAGLPDAEIARRLTEEGYRSPRRACVRESTVCCIRLQPRLFFERPPSHP